jgi:dihydroxyacetone kinase phosphotransfer subunit
MSVSTVSLVLVSHSRQLAEGVRELAEQMTQGKVKIAAVGGSADGRLGTDALAIRSAIESVRSPAGVLVLVDLGSAVLSTQVAIEQLEDGPGRVLLSEAPFVEGAVIAAVEASIEKPLEEVAQAAVAAARMEKISS